VSEGQQKEEAMVAPSTSPLKAGTTLPRQTSLPRSAENSSREDTKTPNKEESKCRLRAEIEGSSVRELKMNDPMEISEITH